MTKKHNSQDIYEQVRQMIVNFELVPGTRITESQVADYFAVSRTPVRAALQKLEGDGLIAIKPKLGCFIRNLDIVQISHYYDARVILENAVIDEIGKLKSHAAIEMLSQQWQPQNYFFGKDITDELKYAEEQFHVKLARASNNSVLLNYIIDINDHIRAVRRLGWPDTKSVNDTYQEHFDICQLILFGKVSAAQAEMTNHIRKSQDLANRITLKQIYGNRKNASPFQPA